MNGPLWETTRLQILHVLGGDNPDKVPAEARDNGVFVRLYTTALVKYLRAAPQAPTDLGSPAFDALTPAPGDIVVEHGAGDLVTVRYKDRLSYTLVVKAGNLQTMTFR